jgi:uncharacterized protein (TIGR03437 family)
LAFFASQGSPSGFVSAVALRLGSSQPVPFQAALSGAAPWLSVTPLAGNVSAGAPATLEVRVQPAGLPAGEYRAEVAIAVGESVRAVPISLIVGPASVALEAPRPGKAQGVSPCQPTMVRTYHRRSPLNFAAEVGSPFPIEVEVRDNCGNPVNEGAVALFSNGEPPLPLITLGSGRFGEAWVPQQAGEQIVVSVRPETELPFEPALTIGAVRIGDRPWVALNGVVNAADFSPGGPAAPGGIVSLFGDSLSRQDGDASVTPLPVELASTRLWIDGVEAPLFAVRASQVNAQVPFETRSGSSAQVIVSAGGRLSAPVPLTIAASQPAIFLLPAAFDGAGRAVALNEDSTLNTSSNPARAGSVVTVFLTGQGATTVNVATGAAAPSTSPFAEAMLPASSVVGDRAADILFLGLTPGFVGLLQANIRLPAELPSNLRTPIQITIGGQTSAPQSIAIGAR